MCCFPLDAVTTFKKETLGLHSDAMEALTDLETEIRALLKTQPDHPGLLAALGGVLLQSGDVKQALSSLQRAALLSPEEPRILADYGAALTVAGRLDEAKAVLCDALERCEDQDNLRFNLARCLQLLGDFSAALIQLSRMIHREKDVCKLQGDLFKAVGNTSSALAAYAEAIRLDPGNPVYLNDLGILLETSGDPAHHRALWQELAGLPDANGVVFFFLGNAHRAAGDLPGARVAYERALILEPSMAEACNNLAMTLGALGLEDESQAMLNRAVTLNPNLVAARSNLGAMLSRGSALDEAEAMLAQAVRLAPDSIDARNNYGALLMRSRRFSEAKTEFQKVLALSPGHALAELNLGLLYLTQGHLDLGWPYYESRWKMPVLAEKRPPLTTPVWTGEPLDGKTLFIFAEQGFGDNLQFIRYLLVLKRRFPTVRLIHYALHSLVDLFQSSFSSDQCEIIPCGAPIPPHDVHCPLMSLPWRCGTVLENIPELGSYLISSAEMPVDAPSPRVGLVWATSETFIYSSAKTIALSLLLPLFDIPHISWVNLQLGKPSEEIAANHLSDRFFDPMPDVKDFNGTAAIVANLDLVISVDTAVAHLTGAMGKPVWMLDRFDTDWRWLPPREDSPWYSTMRIFRQAEFGQWEPVVERVKRELMVWKPE